MMLNILQSPPCQKKKEKKSEKQGFKGTKSMEYSPATPDINASKTCYPSLRAVYEN